jgi:photosystem II stability/assembly factor-like uncharacterized protein
VSHLILPAQTVSWQPTNGPYGGIGFAIAANSNGRLFVGMWDSFGGLCYSSDNGMTWQKGTATALPYVETYAFAFPSDSEAFAGTFGYGIYRTVDGGLNWIPMNNGLSNLLVHSLVSSPKGVLLAGTQGDGVFQSSDHGSNWIPISTGKLSDNSVTALAIDSTGNIYAGCFDGVFAHLYRSLDGGANWTLMSTSLGALQSIVGLTVTPTGVILAATVGKGILRSTDNGLHWNMADSVLSDDIATSFCIGKSNQLFAGTYSGVETSTDDGVNWVPASIGLTNPLIQGIANNSTGTLFVVTYGGGVFRSEDNGGSWVQSSKGLHAFNIQYLASNSMNHVFAAVWNGGVYRTTDLGETWSPFANGLISLDVGALVVGSSGHIFVASEQFGVYRSTDNGENWVLVRNGLPSNSVDYLAITSDNKLFATTYGAGLFQSTNEGDTWGRIDTNLTNLNLGRLGIDSTGNMYITCIQGPGVYRSTDHGIGWTEVKSDDWPTAIAVNQRGDLLLSSRVNGIFRSSSQGLYWLQEMPKPTYDIVANSGGDFFAACGNDGVYRSADGGLSWTQTSSGLSGQSVMDVAATQSGYIFAVTDSSIFRTVRPTTNVKGSHGSGYFSYALCQNYPNPFNPNTTIKFELSQKSQVSLKVFNALGQLVTTLVNGEQEAGYHEVKFNGSNLASGVYFYRIQAGDFVATKRLLLLK